MNKSEQINELAAALAKAQSEFVMPEKNRTVTVTTKTGGKYTFNYADLGAIIEATKGPLAKNGLCVTHSTDLLEQRLWLVTTLLHSSGQWQSSRYPLPATAEAKDLGSAMTYGKRYLMSALLNVVAEDDNDAEPSQISEVASRGTRPIPDVPEPYAPDMFRQDPAARAPTRPAAPPIRTVTQVQSPAPRAQTRKVGL